MIESLLDFTSLSAMYSIYGGLFLVLMHLMWIWQVEIQYTSSTRTISEESFFSIPITKTPVNHQINFMISWMIKYIRRKISSSNNENDPVYLPLTMDKFS